MKVFIRGKKAKYGRICLHLMCLRWCFRPVASKLYGRLGRDAFPYSPSSSTLPQGVEITDKSEWVKRDNTCIPICHQVQQVPSSMLSLFSLTYGQPWAKNIKWKFPERNNLWILNFASVLVAWWTHAPSRIVRPGMWIIPLSGVSILYVEYTTLRETTFTQVLLQYIVIFVLLYY